MSNQPHQMQMKRGFTFGGSLDDAALLACMTKYFGHHVFRSHQLDIVKSLLNGNDAFCTMATGSGKSLLFQLPALALRDRVGILATTVVISPLISLIEDQVQSLRKSGVAAIAIGSSSSREDEERAMHGDYTIVYATPEKISVWKYGLETLAQNVRIACIAVDECHAISEWGHDFRPAYRQLGELRGWLPGIPILALTATATSTVRADIAVSLRLTPNAMQILTSFNRSNLKYTVLNRNSDNDLVRVLLNLQAIYEQTLYMPSRATVAAHLGNHVAVNTQWQPRIDPQDHNSPAITAAATAAARGNKPFQSTLVYVTTKKEAEELASLLRRSSRLQGLRIEYYHAGMAGEERQRVHQDFLADRVSIVLATAAFGMGIHKPDIRLVIHFGMPQSLEAYYQQAGRAGRDGEMSQCVLLYHRQDISRAFQIGTSGLPILVPLNGQNTTTSALIAESSTGATDPVLRRNLHVQALHDRLNKHILAMSEFCRGRGGCRRKYLLSYFGEQPPEPETAIEGGAFDADSNGKVCVSACCDLCDVRVEKEYAAFVAARSAFQQEQQQLLRQRQTVEKLKLDQEREQEQKEPEQASKPNFVLLSNTTSATVRDDGMIEVGNDAYLLLRAVRDSGQVFGLGVPIGLLLGSHDKAIQRLQGYCDLWVFGRGQHRVYEYWRALADQLCDDCSAKDRTLSSVSVTNIVQKEINTGLLGKQLTRGQTGTFAYERYFVTSSGTGFLTRSTMGYAGTHITEALDTTFQASAMATLEGDTAAYGNLNIQARKARLEREAAQAHAHLPLASRHSFLLQPSAELIFHGAAAAKTTTMIGTAVQRISLSKKARTDNNDVSDTSGTHSDAVEEVDKPARRSKSWSHAKPGLNSEQEQQLIRQMNVVQDQGFSTYYVDAAAAVAAFAVSEAALRREMQRKNEERLAQPAPLVPLHRPSVRMYHSVTETPIAVTDTVAAPTPAMEARYTAVPIAPLPLATLNFHSSAPPSTLAALCGDGFNGSITSIGCGALKETLSQRYVPCAPSSNHVVVVPKFSAGSASLLKMNTTATNVGENRENVYDIHREKRVRGV